MTKPTKLTTEKHAKAWLAWAASAVHASGCQCVGCRLARAILSGRDVKDMPQPEA
jgi:hypothetical protein